MDLAKALLYLYLIFPVFSPQQSELFYKFGREELPVTQQEQIRKEIMHFLYPLEITDAEEFADETLPVFPDESDLTYEEGVPLPEGLENPEFGPQSAGSELIDSAEGEKKSIAEEMYINSMNRLSMFVYGEEQFAVNNKNSSKRNLVTVNKDTVIRTRYDEDFYLRDKIVWKNAITLKDSVILSKISYGYAKTNDGKKIVTSKKEEYPQEKRIIENVYDKNGNPIEIIYSHFEDNKEKYQKLVEEAKEEFNKLNSENEKPEADDSKADVPDQTEDNAVPAKSNEEKLNEIIAKIEIPQNKIQDRKILRKYDSQNRLISEEETTVYEEPDPKRRGKKIRKSGSKKNVYTYTAKASVPDYIFYENGKMRIAVNYIDQDTYEQTLYFENAFTVKARYNHGRKIREIFYSGITELKRTEFE